MDGWAELLTEESLQWLLHEGDPWTRYRTLVDLAGGGEEDADVAAARRLMVEHPRVRQLVADLQDWPGYPLKRHNDAGHHLHKLAVLADFGVGPQDPGMGPVVEAVLASRSPGGPFRVTMNISPRYGGSGEDQSLWMLCDAPSVLYALLAMGLGGRPEVQAALDHTVGLIREDGWPCASDPSIRFRGPGRKADPCPYANLLMVKALAQVPERQDSQAARTGAEMLLRHWEEQSGRKLYLFGIGTDYRKLKYPLVWYDILHVVDGLSRLPAARGDPRLAEMVDAIVSQADDEGRFTPSSMYRAWQGWEFADKKAPSPWITFLVLRILKRLSGWGAVPHALEGSASSRK